MLSISEKTTFLYAPLKGGLFQERPPHVSCADLSLVQETGFREDLGVQFPSQALRAGGLCRL